jgi:hypothetical protein
MPLTELTFENYKSFEKRETIKVRPLTILIGRNSSGKSAVSRLPLLLMRAMNSKNETPLELEFDGLDFGGSFVDLIHNRSPHGAIHLGGKFERNLTNGQKSEFKFIAKIQHFKEINFQIVDEFDFIIDNNPSLSLKWVGKDPVVDKMKYLNIESNKSKKVLFKGLLPPQYFYTKKGVEFITKEITKPNYLGPFRDYPQRSYRIPTGVISDTGISGSNAPDLLMDDVLRGKGIILEAVSKWFQEFTRGWVLDLSVEGDRFSIIMRDSQNVSAINIVDVGAGIAQVLPIAVQRFYEKITAKYCKIEVVEQPELHLHPAAHGDVADLYIDAVNDNNDSRFFIETHSENFILRIRRRIAEGKLSPNDVIIYWINYDLKHGEPLQEITITKNGEVDNWPRGVFSEDFDELINLRKAQKNNES